MARKGGGRNEQRRSGVLPLPRRGTLGSSEVAGFRLALAGLSNRFCMPLRSKPVVGRAVPDDAEVLALLGRALKVQQGDQATSFTAEAVRRDGFGTSPRFEAWVAELDCQAVGYSATTALD